MSEKRFTFGAVSPNVAMIKDNGEPMNIGEVVHKLNEQQATITAQKKGLDEYMDNIIALSKENEKLRKELDNFKPVMFQDVRKGTVILYSKGDIDE